MLLGNKRKSATANLEDDEEEPCAKRAATGPTPVVTNGVDGLENAALVPSQNGIVPTPEYLRPAVLNPSISVAQVRLGVPKIRSHILRPLEKGTLQADTTLDDASEDPRKYHHRSQE